jgi:hypothetical protein
MGRFRVLDRLNHNGKVIEPGKHVVIDDEDAAEQLLDLGVIGEAGTDASADDDGTAAQEKPASAPAAKPARAKGKAKARTPAAPPAAAPAQSPPAAPAAGDAGEGQPAS